MKRDLRVTVTKRLIREALLGLLETNPLEKIKVSQLCESAGVNRATFYRHYESIHDVLREIELEFIQQMPRPAGIPRTPEEAHSHVKAMCNYFYANADMIRLLFLNRTDGDMMQGMNDFYSSFLEIRKKAPPMPDMDEDTAKAITALVSGGGYWLLRQWILGDIRKTPDQIADILCRLIGWHDRGF